MRMAYGLANFSLRADKLFLRSGMCLSSTQLSRDTIEFKLVYLVSKGTTSGVNFPRFVNSRETGIRKLPIFPGFPGKSRDSRPFFPGNSGKWPKNPGIPGKFPSRESRPTPLVMTKKFKFWPSNFLAITFEPVVRLIPNFECRKICMFLGLFAKSVSPLSQ